MRDRLLNLVAVNFIFSLVISLGFSDISGAQAETFQQYRQAFELGDFSKALSIADVGLGAAKDDADRRLFYLGKALSAMQLQDYAKAEEALQKLVDERTNLAEYAHYFYAKILLKEGKPLEARKQLQKILELSPNIKLKIESQFELARIANNEKNYKQARSILQPLERKQKHEENHPEILYQLARAEKGLRNSNGFCRWIRKLYAQNPEYPLLDSWGPYLSENKFEGDATKCISTVEEIRSRFKNLLWAGMLERAKKEVDSLRGRSLLDKFVVDKLEAQVHLQEGDVNLALNLLLPYYPAQKHDFHYLVLLSNTAARAGEGQAAIGTYYAAYKLSPGSKTGKQALYQSAFLSYQFQDYDGAARRIQEFIKKYRNSGLSRDARWHLAWIRYLKADYNGAYNAFSEIKSERVSRKVKAASADRINYWMAMCLFREGQYVQARPLFEALAREQLMSYYSMAAQARINKIDSLVPKLAKLAASSLRKINRISASDFLIPSDDWRGDNSEKTTEESESEENISPVVADNDEPPAAEDVVEGLSDESGDSESVAVSPAEKEEEKVTSFSNPMLVKRFERARDMMMIGQNDWAKWDLYDIERKTSNHEYLKTLMSEYEKIDNYNRSSYIGQIYFGSQRLHNGIEGVRYLWEHTYPRAYADQVTRYSKSFDIPNEIVWAIMRAESQYKRDVISPVGAMGLMQVMPNTALRVAQLLSDEKFEARKLMDPEPAIKIGSKYLQRLIKKFDGNMALVAASYNAGPHRVRSWLASFGQLDMDEFIEHIPFLETRNYVKKVLLNYAVYSKLYSKKEAPFNLSEAIKFRVTDPVPTKETWEDI
jgi:soluble lytic murein transglycosylase